MILKRVAWVAAAVIAFSGISLAQVGAIEGKVIAEDGKPLPGAAIRIVRTDIRGNYKIKSDKRGEFQYYGLQVGSYDVFLDVDGRVADSVKGLRVQFQGVTSVVFDLQKVKQRNDALNRAAAAGTMTKEQQKGMTQQERAAFEQVKKQREAQVSKNKALNDAFNAGMQAMECGKNPAPCAAAAPPAPAPGQPAAQGPMTSSQYFEQAITAFKKAAELDPTQAAIWPNMADAYSGLANTKTGAEKDAALNAAAENYLKAIAIKPLDAASHNNYALILARQGKFEDAKAELKKAAELDPPGAGKYYYNLGALLVNAGQWMPAAEVFKKAIELTPNYAEAHYQYAICLSAQLTTGPDGKPIAPPGMAEELQKYLELAPAGPNAQTAKDMLATLSSAIQTTLTNPNAAPPPKRTKKK